MTSTMYANMKKKMLLLLFMALLPLAMMAQTAIVDGIKYKIYTSDNRAEVRSRNNYRGNLVIPETVDYDGNTYTVTGFQEEAFYECSNLTSVIIPNSVTSIGKNAFYFCNNLTSVTFGNSVATIGEKAFYFCKKLTSITIPSSVTNIEKEAFRLCTNISSVTINSSNVKIDIGAFIDIEAVFDWPEDFDYGGYSSLKEFINNTCIQSFQFADKAKVTISDAGVATFYSFRGLNFDGFDIWNDFRVFVATKYDKRRSKVDMLEVEEVPAYTGLLLVGTPGTYEVPYKPSGEIAPVESNLLTGTIDPKFIPSTEDDMTNFVLYYKSSENERPVFRPLANGFNLKANRAYLQIPTADLPGASAGSKMSIAFDDETGIEEIVNGKSSNGKSPDAWYSIDGRRLGKTPTQKGVYINRNKKTFIK